jgi:hypothetical protein
MFKFKRKIQSTETHEGEMEMEETYLFTVVKIVKPDKTTYEVEKITCANPEVSISNEYYGKLRDAIIKRCTKLGIDKPQS